MDKGFTSPFPSESHICDSLKRATSTETLVLATVKQAVQAGILPVIGVVANAVINMGSFNLECLCTFQMLPFIKSKKS